MLPCLVCCIIWLIRSSCCLVSPSLTDTLLIFGELGAEGDKEEQDDEEEDDEEDEDDEKDTLLGPSTANDVQMAPCGELASPEMMMMISL